jgi:hypothetical protein
MSPDDPDAYANLDAIEELKQSKGYYLVAQRIALVVETKREMLESERMITRPDEANYTRGLIAGMKLCLQLASMLEAEMKEEIEETAAEARKGR